MVKNDQGRLTPTTLGVALLNGYDQLDLMAMSKPYLRAAVEQDLTRICTGYEHAHIRLVCRLLASQHAVFVQRKAFRGGRGGMPRADAPCLSQDHRKYTCDCCSHR
jgi:hypothetical protein